MDFRHLIVTCLFSKLRLPFDNQKVKENYAIFKRNVKVFLYKEQVFWKELQGLFTKLSKAQGSKAHLGGI